MTSDLALVLALLGATIAMFAVNRPRMDATALIMMAVLPLTGVISASEALAASTAFMTPVSSPVTTLVVGPGNYDLFDFLRVGVPLALMTMGLCNLLVPLVFPF